ncbi:YihY/virulence factor BrkB family protein [Phytohalomonas tamaricis]|uniref:YihY/virulence factor BrkB family protein n=1 Tax=Phytohalomonas tamaricis TaxID=2081032 RepID=UPI000D0AF23D|nr:YihY/virulence factor BrkB family protein [Phytohalomonas tamaricis]
MARHDKQHDYRGRHAERPTEITTSGWRDTFLRVKEQLDRDHVTLIAAGVAFYGLLAIFPAIAALISLWGLLLDPQQIEQQITSLGSILPPEAASLLEQQARKVVKNTGSGINLTAIGGILFAVFSASRGVKGLIEGMNVVYDEDESRSLIKRTLMTLALTSGLIITTIVTLAALIFIPAVAGHLPLGDTVSTLILYSRWPLLIVLAMLSIAVLYRYGPHRAKPRWEWVSIGTVSATLLWILGSIGFSLYVRNFSSFDEIYGSLGAVVILLMWFWLSAFIVLLGGELNNEMERQTKRDTTERPEQSIGHRNAHAADTVGKKP